MVDWVRYLINVLFFDITLLYYYINLRSSIIFCLSSGDLYVSLGIYLSCSFVTLSELFCCKGSETFVILSGILLPMKSPSLLLLFELLFWKEF